MAKDWLQRSFREISKQVSDVVERVVRPSDAETGPSGGEPRADSRPIPATPMPRPWYDWLLDSLPTVMMIVGLLFGGICANFDATFVWAIFGFMLVAGAPIVFYLQRIERKMNDWIDLQRRWHD